MDVRIGTCGYQFYDPGEEWRDEYVSRLQAYSDAYRVGEITRTFYSLPTLKTAARWRREAVDSFEFTVKGWQAITHSWRSPTWNDHREDVPEEQTGDVGHFRPTEVVHDAWEQTKAVANALEANVVLLQTPPSFGPTDDNVANMREFFSTIDRDGLQIAWESRGGWHEERELVKSLCDDLDLVDVVDPFRAEPVSESSIAYLRLHGLNGDRYDYDYQYTDEELTDLVSILRSLSERYETVYCLFNNFEMYSDAERVAQLLANG